MAEDAVVDQLLALLAELGATEATVGDDRTWTLPDSRKIVFMQEKRWEFSSRPGGPLIRYSPVRLIERLAPRAAPEPTWDQNHPGFVEWVHFRNPMRAVIELGRAEAFRIYLNDVEPRYTHQVPFYYPKDWYGEPNRGWRQYYIFDERDSGRCRDCFCNLDWEHYIDVWDVHHLTRGEGADHDFENLLLLCRPCHRKRHYRR